MRIRSRVYAHTRFPLLSRKPMTSADLGAANVVGWQPGTTTGAENQALRQAPAQETVTSNKIYHSVEGEPNINFFCAPVCGKDITCDSQPSSSPLPLFYLPHLPTSPSFSPGLHSPIPFNRRLLPPSVSVPDSGYLIFFAQRFTLR